jgi:hypothetical protein
MKARGDFHENFISFGFVDEIPEIGKSPKSCEIKITEKF